MAASLRSSSLRDQRRVEDDYQDYHYSRGNPYKDRREIAHSYPKHRRTADVGVKIKGRATEEPTYQSVPGTEDSSEDRISQRDKRSSRSHQRPSRGEDSSNRSRWLDRAPSADQGQDCDDSEIPIARRSRRSNNKSPYREQHKFRVRRERSRSPARPSRSTRDFYSTNRHRERDYSPPLLSREEFRSDNLAGVSGFTDHLAKESYLSSTQRRQPRSPAPLYRQNPSATRRRFSSADRDSESSFKSPLNIDQVSTRYGTERKEKDHVKSYYQASRSRERSSHHHRGTRHRRRDRRSSTPIEARQLHRTSRRSPSPLESEEVKSRDKKMQPSTRPIQSILDDSPHPPSPPRPIPSFDSDSHTSGIARDIFSMHGMKSNDVHGANRPARPQQIDTRQTYSTSPQWTPTSSHHGSPQSGSPFNHGRGGWGGQPQHFHGQPGLVRSHSIVQPR